MELEIGGRLAELIWFIVAVGFIFGLIERWWHWSSRRKP